MDHGLCKNLCLRLAGLPAVSEHTCDRWLASRLPADRQGRKVLLRQPGYPEGTRGFPSHDYSWFGFIGNLNLKFFSYLSLSNSNANKPTIG